jgi:hypothetical protein
VARNLHVYPKAVIDGSTWTYLVKVFDQDTRTNTRFEHVVPAAVTAEVPLRLLKVSWDMTVADSDSDADVDDALFVDTASGGPTNGETLWETWQGLADPKIAGLTSPYTAADFFAEWSQQDTARIRNAARRILINGRGWTVVSGTVHQHEGDHSNTDE